MNPVKHVPVTQLEIQAGIQRLGLAGQPVCVHSSLRSFGHVLGGAQTVVQAFIEEGCTMMVPSHSYDFSVAPPQDQQVERNGVIYDALYPRANVGIDKIYTPATKEIDPDMGAIAAAVLNFPGSVRGNHPLNSFSAVGPLAERLIAGQAPLALHAPLQALVEEAGYVLLMGVGLDSMTLLHYAEQEAGRIVFRRWANDREGHVQMVEAGGCSDGFEHLAPVLQPLQRETRVGESRWQLFPAKQAVQAVAAAIRKDPQITHCGRPDCERCNDAVLGGPIL